MFSTAFTTKVRDLVIPIGEDAISPVVQGDFETNDAEALMIVSRPTNEPIDGHLQVAGSGVATELSDFYDLEDTDGYLVFTPNPGRARVYKMLPMPSWRIKLDAVTSQENVFEVYKIHR